MLVKLSEVITTQYKDLKRNKMPPPTTPKLDSFEEFEKSTSEAKLCA